MADSSSSLVLDSIEPHRFDVLSISEKEVLYKHLYDFIDLMDEACISELFSGNLSDIDKIYQVLLEENYNILSLKKVTPILTLDSVPHLKSGYEDYLRRANLNYFTQSVLPHFEMNWHNIEWFKMVQLYRLLCIMAARDHCFGEGTRIRMFDGSLKNVEDIVEGDLVMGPDSSPRKVLSLHRGIDQLYQVRQTRGDSYIVNSQHILSGYSPHFYDDKKVKRLAKSIEVSVEKFLSYSKDKRSHFRGYKVSIDYPYQEVLLEPYFLGLWLGDGTASNQCVTTIDSEIVQYLESYSKRLGEDYYCDYNSRGSFDCWIRTRKVGRGHKHSLLKGLREYNLIDNKHIPQKYLLNSVEVRRQLLAGLIDSDGSISDNICYYTTISEVLANDIRELCYSLGFRVTLRKNESFIKSLQRRYITYELIISGLLDKIPTLLKRKQVRFNGKGSSYYTPEPIHDYPVSLISSLQVESIGRGKYFGFECDGDHRFLLEDSTVVHNSKSYSFSFAYILWRLYRYAKPTSLVTPPDDIKYYKEGMLITNEFKLAKKLLKKVKQEIESNEVLREALLPTKNSGGWANESLTCKNGSEITLSSFRTSNRGPHPGWIVVDDFLDKSAIYSKEQREKFMEVFNAEIMNMILPQGQVLVVGTPFHEKDLYANLKEARNWRVFEYPAVFPDGSLLWENRYNFQALMDKRVSLGAMIFSREILVRPISDSVSIFPWSILETSFIGMEKYTLVENLMSFPVKFKKVAAGVDLAISGNVGADYMVIIVVGLDELNRIWLLHMTRLHGAGYNEQIATLQRINHSFNPSVILMETNGFQKIMSQLSRDNGINNIVEFTTTGNNKKDAYEGLPSLAVLFERGEFKFPRGDEKSRELTNLLCGELNSVAFDDDRGKLESVGEHDDTAMGLFFATKALKYINNDIFLSMI